MICKHFIISLVCVAISCRSAWSAQNQPKRGVVELFEDDAEALLKILTNPGDAGGNGAAEGKVVFAGTKSIKITEYQRFHRTVPGWNFAIRDKPKPGEYRYLRFAWKAAGANCLMVQIHDALDWNIRYTAGTNPYGWATRFVTDKAPAAWSLVTVDLFKDFGERTITGIALTIHGGAGYFDHVYLGRSIDDLDRIDANRLKDKKLELMPAELEQNWKDLAAEDAAQAYRAFWTLVAGRDRSVAFLKEKLQGKAPTDKDQIKQWIRDLDSEVFAAREKATVELKKRIEDAAPLLEAELAASPSGEVRRRIEILLAGRTGKDSERGRREKAERIMRFVAAPE